ncbi:hypothetical protein ACLOJK_031178 [Asimina triloba]
MTTGKIPSQAGDPGPRGKPLPEIGNATSSSLPFAHKYSLFPLYWLDAKSNSPSLCTATQVSYDSRAITIDGQRRLILSGAIHYPRSTPEMWPDLMQKAKDGGLNTIETYVFWNAHEPRRQEYHFEGNYDLVRFIKTIQQAGMYCILRIGPYACAEWNYGYKQWGQPDPHRPAEDVAMGVALFFKSGGTLNNYYMYHGGSNFGRTAGPFITTSYDYDAPLDEYGNLQQPKWGHLKILHQTLLSMENALVYGDPTNTDLGNGVSATMYKSPNGTAGCFLANQNERSDATVNFQGNSYSIPAWSVSILPDCKTVAYNTAKVTNQISMMVKQPNSVDQNAAAGLKWVWQDEVIRDALKGQGGTFDSPTPLEQLNITGDASDYMWYMTSLFLTDSDPLQGKQVTLRVKTTGQGLYAFFNGKLVGSQYGVAGNYKFVFEAPVTMQPKRNFISLLSVIVGLQNYGPFFDTFPTGIINGPVALVADGNIVKDLSANHWSYKVGLIGEAQQIQNDDPAKAAKWSADVLPIGRPMVWYKTTFTAPPGTDPVVVDLQGLGKGVAWVNGQSLGRYWPSPKATGRGCGQCDYRGRYNAEKCVTGCGESTQRWYHVPRSFLRGNGENTLILFEEMGGDPSKVNFQTVTVGTACGSTDEGANLEISCQGGRTFSAVQFASYGNPQGTCGSFQKGNCESSNALSAVQQACVGKTSCSISVNDATLGSTSCPADVVKKLSVEAVC